MTFEEQEQAWDLYQIDPMLTCTCDEVHTCQQCSEPEKTKEKFNFVIHQLKRKKIQAKLISNGFYNGEINFKEFKERMNRVLNQST